MPGRQQPDGFRVAVRVVFVIDLASPGPLETSPEYEAYLGTFQLNKLTSVKREATDRWPNG